MVDEKIEIMGDEKEELKLSEHYLVPKHEIMNEKEGTELLKKFKITKKQLPVITHLDPMVKEIDAKMGDIIKITRNSQVAGKIFYYRIVSK